MTVDQDESNHEILLLLIRAGSGARDGEGTGGGPTELGKLMA